jgi:MinD-like ATPase involved in chromosome partitioning or flagellar assembly
MSSNDDPNGREEQHLLFDETGGGRDDHSDYSAERPVNLREQKLRPRTDAESATLRLRPDSPAHPGGEARDPADPYGVGAGHAVSVAISAAELDELREEQLRRVLGRPAGVESDPATWGWRGKANALGARLTPAREEIEFRRAVERIRQPLPGTPLIVVCNPKGGGGTTPAALMLSAIFGRHRGHGVVAWDNNETRGTLATRAATAPKAVPTTWDLLEHAAQLCSADVVASALGRFLLPQPTGDEVLASDQSSKRARMIGEDECTAVLAVLRRHRTMVVVDTGNNERGEAFLWSIRHATQLVVPLTYRRDAAHMVLRTLDGIAARGHEELVRSAIVVLAEGTATTPAAREAVHEALARAEISTILHVPVDADLAGGERIVFSRLADPTVRAWTQVAAVVADSTADVLTHTEPVLHAGHAPQSRQAPAEFDARWGPRPTGPPRRTRHDPDQRMYRRSGEVAG